MNVLGESVERPVKAHEKNLETIVNAAKCGCLALLECRLRTTGEKVAVLVAVNRDGEMRTFVPFAVFMNGNPYELLDPPNPMGGFYDDDNKERKE